MKCPYCGEKITWKNEGCAQIPVCGCGGAGNIFVKEWWVNYYG